MLKDMRVLVTARSFGHHDPSLRAELGAAVGEVRYNPTGNTLSAAEVLPLVADCDGYIAGVDEIPAAVLQASTRLKVISRYGVGVDRIDLEEARRLGIVVTNTPGANSSSVADLTVGLLLSLARQIPQAVQAVRAGSWPRINGVSLEGKTVGLLGFGSIGQLVARRLQAFDAEILVCDPRLADEESASHGIGVCTREELLARADFVSLHLPATDETRGLVDSDFLNQMKPGGYLINTARGELINDNALLAALDSGHLSGAGLDVFAAEPPDPANPLLNHPAVLATPHMAAHADGATNAMGRAALDDCLAVLRGEEPLHRVI
ncbi:MAG: phosphoglycerate dehydrogenase [Anaerolineales bacterium]|nr:phosphoglycerate dehydrogenase [Anaerolineales bacterium]